MKFPRLKPEKDRRRKLTPKEVEQIKKLRAEHVPQKEIAAMFNVSRATVYYHCLTPEKLQATRRRTIEWTRQHMKDDDYREKYNEKNRETHRYIRSVHPKESRDYDRESMRKWREAHRT